MNNFNQINVGQNISCIYGIDYSSLTKEELEIEKKKIRIKIKSAVNRGDLADLSVYNDRLDDVSFFLFKY